MAVHRSAYIHPDARIHESCEIGVNVVIDGPVSVGPGCQLGPSVVLMGNTEIGAGCSVHAHAVIGDVPQDHKFKGQESYCRVGENCVIREGVTIHRACNEGAATIVGNRCYLMTNCHIGHDCVLDDEVTLVSGALLGGHVQVGAKAIVSGNVGVHQFVRIGELAMVGAVSFVGQDIPPFMMTDHCGSIVGLNMVGMRRAGMSIAERNDVKALYRYIFRLGLPVGTAKEVGRAMVATGAGHRFIKFFEDASHRGIGGNGGRLRLAG
jgi:UDP-N-acetylglucosamine acyltransferase